MIAKNIDLSFDAATMYWFLNNRRCPKLSKSSSNTARPTFGIFPNQIINLFIIAVILKLSSLVISTDGKYEILVLIGAAVVITFMIMLRIIFFGVIGGVILSWVSPNRSNAFIQIIEEISYKSLAPIRKYIPSAGGLDFSPIFVLILINLLESFLSDILRSLESIG